MGVEEEHDDSEFGFDFSESNTASAGNVTDTVTRNVDGCTIRTVLPIHNDGTVELGEEKAHVLSGELAFFLRSGENDKGPDVFDHAAGGAGELLAGGLGALVLLGLQGQRLRLPGARRLARGGPAGCWGAEGFGR